MQSAHEAEQRFWAEVEACAQVEGEERAAREASLWQHWGAERAVLFTDLSGFSRAVAEHGILHFLELVRRKRELLGAVLSQHEGRAVKSEADSMLVVFESARAALECALAMQRACQEANRARPLEQVGGGVQWFTARAYSPSPHVHKQMKTGMDLVGLK